MCKWCMIYAYFSPYWDKDNFFTGAILWIEDLYFSQKQHFEVKNAASHFTRHYLMDCGLLVDIVMFVSAVWTFHSDGTHSLQKTHWWASNACKHWQSWQVNDVYCFKIWTDFKFHVFQRLLSSDDFVRSRQFPGLGGVMCCWPFLIWCQATCCWPGWLRGMKKGSWFNLLIGVQRLWRDLCSPDRISLLKTPPPLVNHLLTASCGATQHSDYNEHRSSTRYIKAIMSNGPLQRQHTVQALFHPTKSQQAISVHQTPKQHEGQKTYSPRGSTSSWGLIWVGQSSRPWQFYKSGDWAYPQMSRCQMWPKAMRFNQRRWAATKSNCVDFFSNGSINYQ